MNQSPPPAVPGALSHSAAALETERHILHARNYPPAVLSAVAKATELVEWIATHGYLHAALTPALTQRKQAAATLSSAPQPRLAPEHHRLINRLIVLRAVIQAEATESPPATPNQVAYLRERYEELAEDERAWCRSVMGGG